MAPRVRRSCSKVSQPPLSSSAHAEPRQHLFVAFQIHCQSRQNDGGIGLVSMANAEVDAIQLQDTPMRLQRTQPPRLKLVSQALIEATNRAGAGGHSQ